MRLAIAPPSSRPARTGCTHGWLAAAQTYSGHGTHIDVLVASARALVNALNKMIDANRSENVRVVAMPGKRTSPTCDDALWAVCRKPAGVCNLGRRPQPVVRRDTVVACLLGLTARRPLQAKRYEKQWGSGVRRHT
jgi:hypothetical protein